ncbi:hypothetical protein GCM10022379_61570 [Micromonospora maritima]
MTRALTADPAAPGRLRAQHSPRAAPAQPRAALILELWFLFRGDSHGLSGGHNSKVGGLVGGGRRCVSPAPGRTRDVPPARLAGAGRNGVGVSRVGMQPWCPARPAPMGWMSGSTVVGATSGAESPGGRWRCNPVNDRAG